MLPDLQPFTSSHTLAAKRQLAQRALARRRLIHYILRFRPNYKAGWVHKLVCAKIEKFMLDVEHLRSPRLMFTMPPRTGKSTIVSEDGISWMMGHHPEWEFIAASYAVSLPLGFSRRVKNRIGLAEYRALFPETQLDPKAQATEGWYTTRGGGYLPAGVDGGLTGKGAHVLSIDDPVKDDKEAESELIRERAWNWWNAVADTRLAPGAGVLHTQTRWHDEDLGGKFLTQELELTKEVDEMIDVAAEQLEDPGLDGDAKQVLEAKIRAFEVEKEREIVHWEVINFPALANSDEWLTDDDQLVESMDRPKNAVRKLRSKDEALHPDRYDEFFYRRKRKTTIPRIWSALYQQNPTPDEGTYWQRSYFRYERLPTPGEMAGWFIFQAWDLAIGQRARNDWTVGLTGALDFDSNLHLINHTRVRTDALASLILDSTIPYQHKLRKVGIEQGQIQMSVMPEVRRLIDEYRKNRKLIHVPVFDDRLKPITDKEARGIPAQGLGQQGRIWVPENQPWVEEFIGRLLRFPYGAWDDDHDALSWLVRLVNFHTAPRRLSVKPKPMSERPWRERVKAHIEDQGRGGGYLGA